MQRKLPILSIVVACFLMANELATAAPPGTAFTYQGQLKSSGSPANGNINMSFSLWDDVAGGTQQGSTLTFDGTGGNPPSIAVSSGLFSVQLDFGIDPYAANAALWLEITVNGTTLTPRQGLTPTPFALNTRGVNVDAVGNVGIGTTSPIAPLHVVGSNPFPHLTVQASSDAPYGAFMSLDAEATEGGQNWYMFSSGGGAGEGQGKLVFQNHSNGLNPLTITYDGNVGIGTTSPSNNLSVSGNADFGGNVGIGTTTPTEALEVRSSTSAIAIKFGGPFGTGSLYGGSDSIGINTDDGTTGLSIDQTSKNVSIGAHLGIGTTSPASGLSVVGDVDITGSRLHVGTNGNVGIGTPSPAGKLDVRGDVKLGSSGQYFAVGGGDNLRIIRGIVDQNGTVISGSGYSVVRNSTGNYTVTFSPGFSDVPALLVTPFSGGAPRIATTNAVSAANGTALIWTTGGALADAIFSFTAIGLK